MDPETDNTQSAHHNITAIENGKFQKLRAVLVVEDSLNGAFFFTNSR